MLNQEIRFPLSARLQGVGFWDYAHIYGETGDFTGLRVRNSLGTGVRLLLPFIIVRVDYGYPLNQDFVNDKGRWYFAIGQALNRLVWIDNTRSDRQIVQDEIFTGRNNAWRAFAIDIDDGFVRFLSELQRHGCLYECRY